MFYDERGWYASIFTLDPNTGAIETNVRTNFLYSFLTFPTVIETSFGNRFKINTGIGINNSLRIGGATKADGKNVLSLAFLHPEVKSPDWDWSYVLELGFGVKISKSLGFKIEGSYFKSLTPTGHYEPIEEEVFHKGYRILFGIERTIMSQPSK